jgi:hypothetical protein
MIEQRSLLDQTSSLRSYYLAPAVSSYACHQEGTESSPGPMRRPVSVEALKRFSKATLPSKTCVACRRPFAWRKKWSRNWEEVKYCSDRCRDVRIAKPLKATSSKV